nr:PIN-like domain-containing protein [Desulforamulus aquiferis]
MLDGIIGEPYAQDRVNAIEKEGIERYKYNVPPGFKDKDDKDKQSYRTYGDIRYQQLYGDLIVWNQVIDKAKESSTPIILVTEDRKEDWWEKDGQKIKRPHPQLVQEFLNRTHQKFYMYRTDNFVSNGIKYFGTDVTEEQFQELTDEIKNIRRVEEIDNDFKEVIGALNEIHEIELNNENRFSPFYKDQVLYVPVRVITKLLGIDHNNIYFNGEKMVLTLISDHKVVEIDILNNLVIINGQQLLDVTEPIAYIKNGVTFLRYPLLKSIFTRPTFVKKQDEM